jgi:hypothetical protein
MASDSSAIEIARRRRAGGELAVVRFGRDLLGHSQQIVGRVTHGRDHDHHLMSARRTVCITRSATYRSFATSATLLPPYF